METLPTPSFFTQVLLILIKETIKIRADIASRGMSLTASTRNAFQAFETTPFRGGGGERVSSYLQKHRQG